jgi:hypothetical protein
VVRVAPIKADTFSIGTFLLNAKYRIPLLQRPFAWTEEQAIELRSDILPLIEASEEDENQHFFGSIVLLMAPGPRTAIIDGQQRLTTITVLLALLHYATERVGAQSKEAGGPAAEGIVNTADQLATKLRTHLLFQGAMDAEGKTRQQARLEVSPEIAKVYGALLKGEHPKFKDYPVDTPPWLLLKIAEYFRTNIVEPDGFHDMEFVDRLRHLQRVSDVILDQLLVVSLETSNANAGYELFESLNARGRPLNALDLVKTWALGHMSDLGEQEERRVARVMAELSAGNVSKQLAFFEDYFRLRARRHPKKDSPKTFAKDSRLYIFKDPDLTLDPPPGRIQDRIVDRLDEMVRLTPTWKAISANRLPEDSFPVDEDQRRLWTEFRMRLLRQELSHTLSTPLFLSAADLCGRSKDLVALSSFIHDVERFFFRLKVICGAPVSTIEKCYFDLMKSFSHAETLDLGASRVKLQEVLDAEAGDTKFRQRILEKLTYTPAARKRIKYFLFTLWNYSLPNPPKLDVPEYGQYTIEHVAPQNGHQLPNPEDVHTIGNLVLVDPKINPGLSNRPFQEKKQYLADKKLVENLETQVPDTRNVFDEIDWNEETIYERTRRLQDRAVEVFSLT